MDNFDLKKFLKESKAIENLNPSFKALNENESLKNTIREMAIAELGGEGTIKVGSLVTIPKDEFDGKVIAVNGDEITVKTPFGNEKYNIKDIELLGGEYEIGEAKKDKMTKEAMKKQIKDMIVAELDSAGDLSIDTAPGVDAYRSFSEGEDELEEAKKKKDEDVENVEDVEITDTTEEIPAEDIPADEAPAAVDGGLEDIAADMKGTEADLMDNLMKAFQIAKGMGNEKLETQVGNTLKFFVSEYIGGGEG
jgi:hypothetical protein